MQNKSIIVALDTTNLGDTKLLLDQLDPAKCMVKVGSVLFNAEGRAALDLAANAGFEIFFDIKFHDIPNTVEQSIRSFKGYPIQLLTTHISGGASMLKAALAAADVIDAKCIGVSVLTSMSNEETQAIYQQDTQTLVTRMFELAENVGLDGVVCSPHELAAANTMLTQALKITPGIRNDTNPADDQTRTMSAQEAIAHGADYLVIGRPITAAPNIAEAFAEIYTSIHG